MVGKKVAIGGKPKAKSNNEVATNDWVKNRNTEEVKMKRLTVDVTEDLHRRIKSDCAGRGLKMADEIRALLEQHFS